MIYRKPDNVTYVDMCIYIDNTAYTDKHDAQTIFEYLFHLVKHLAKKKDIFVVMNTTMILVFSEPLVLT